MILHVQESLAGENERAEQGDTPQHRLNSVWH